MAGLFSAITATASVLSACLSSDASDKTELVRNVVKELRKNSLAIQTDGSLTKFLSQFVVEPVIIVSKNAKRSDIIDKIFTVNTDIFCSFYLQAFNVLTSMYKVDLNVAINLLSSDTSSFKSLVGGKVLDFIEDGNLTLEARKDWVAELESGSKYLNFSVSTEAVVTKDLLTILQKQPNGEYNKYMDLLATANIEQANYIINACADGIVHKAKKNGRDLIINQDSTFLELASRKPSVKNAEKGLTEKEFSVLCAALGGDHTKYKGKYRKGDDIREDIKTLKIISDDTMMYSNSKIADNAAENLYGIHHREISLKLTVTNKTNDSETTHNLIIPITVKTHIIVTDVSNIINMLKPNDRTKSFSYRLDEYRSGSISLKELIFCGDLVSQYKKNKLSDKDGLLNIIKQREESAISKAFAKGNKLIQGFERFYNMLIVTADEKILLNKHIGGDILNERYKQELLTEARALTISILDDDYERLYILTKDIRGKSEASYKSIAKKKDNGVSDEMFKALLANRPPII